MHEIKIVGLNAAVYCKSAFCQSNTHVMVDTLVLKDGINVLGGEIDSGGWGVSYMLSMSGYDRKMLFTCWEGENTIYLDGQGVTLSELARRSCYMDRCCPLFSRKRSVRSLVIKALKKSGVPYSVEEIRQAFNISDFRFERPLGGVGNEIFRCMAAIGVASGKDIFCFPWMSAQMLGYYQRQIFDPIEELARLGKTVILPRSDGEVKRIQPVGLIPYTASP